MNISDFATMSLDYPAVDAPIIKVSLSILWQRVDKKVFSHLNSLMIADCAKSQMRTRRSSPAEANIRPSGEKESAKIAPRWPLNTRT